MNLNKDDIKTQKQAIEYEMEENRPRKAKKKCNNFINGYVDGWEKHSDAGKGDKNRMFDWTTSDRISEEMKRIFKK